MAIRNDQYKKMNPYAVKDKRRAFLQATVEDLSYRLNTATYDELRVSSIKAGKAIAERMREMRRASQAGKGALPQTYGAFMDLLQKAGYSRVPESVGKNVSIGELRRRIKLFNQFFNYKISTQFDYELSKRLQYEKWGKAFKTQEDYEAARQYAWAKLFPVLADSNVVFNLVETGKINLMEVAEKIAAENGVELLRPSVFGGTDIEEDISDMEIKGKSKDQIEAEVEQLLIDNGLIGGSRNGTGGRFKSMPKRR